MDKTVKAGLMGFIVGDALGVPVEFIDRSVLEIKPVTEMLEYGTHNVKKGTWSDDTSMVLATIDSIIEQNKIDYKDISLKFQNFLNYAAYTPYKEVFDVGRTCFKAVMSYSESIDPRKCGLDSLYDNGNGSLMRMLPLVYYLDDKRFKDNVIKNYVDDLSSLTHKHEISKMGCYLFVKYALFLLEGKSKETSYTLLKILNFDYSKETIEIYNNILKNDIKNVKVKSSGYIVDTLESVIHTILNTSNFKEALLYSVNLGGDTDTVGALTGLLAGIIYGYEEIPNEWIEVLAKNKLLLKISEVYQIVINEKHKKYY